MNNIVFEMKNQFLQNIYCYFILILEVLTKDKKGTVVRVVLIGTMKFSNATRPEGSNLYSNSNTPFKKVILMERLR